MEYSNDKNTTDPVSFSTPKDANRTSSRDTEKNVLFGSDYKRETNIDVEPESNYCGVCGFKPAFLRSFANKKAFITVFCMTSVLQGMFYTYFVSALTTIEKLYQIRSTTTGLLMSAAEIGQITGVLWLTYYGGQGNRPKWIACGMLVFSFAVLLASSPHFLLNDHHNLPEISESSSSQHSSSLASSSRSGLTFMKNKLCNSDNSGSQHGYGYDHRLIRDSNRTSESCSSNVNDSPNRLTKTVLGIFFVSVLLVGIGSTTTNTLGIPYIDDNVAPGESPLYFGK